MDPNEQRDWFRTVGHFPTQTVTNRTTAGVTSSIFATDIIPGYGGGGPTHHVLAMGVDPMGGPDTYYRPSVESNDLATGANNRIELVGRHYYAGAGRSSLFAGNDINGAWANRPKLNYTGPFENEALAMSPQMYAPGSTAGNVIREVWQTEFDHNFHGTSTQAGPSNVHTFWNSAFGAMNSIDHAFRVNGESVYGWWYSSSFSGFVTSYQEAGFPPYTISPRGRAVAHYGRYVAETWFLPMTRTRGTVNFNTTTAYNAGSIDPKISAFEDVNGKFISIVMFTPNFSTNTSNINTATSSGNISSGYGTGGINGTNDPTRGSVNVGRIEVVLPEGFIATSATAMRTYGNDMSSGAAWDDQPAGSPRYWIDEPAFLSTTGDGNSSVEVSLPGGNVISIKVIGEWSSSYLALNPRHFESRPQWKGRLTTPFPLN
jgi:hypothetical protein